MPWPWRRRREQPRHALPRQGASWAEPAYPAAVTPAAAPAVLPAEPAEPAGSAEAAGEPVVPAPPAGVPQQSSGVLLGFADGSQVALDERDPHAVALVAVASVLSQRRAGH